MLITAQRSSVSASLGFSVSNFVLQLWRKVRSYETNFRTESQSSPMINSFDFIAGVHAMDILVAVVHLLTPSVSVYTTLRGTTVNGVRHSTMTNRGAMAPQAMASLASYVTVTVMRQAASTMPLPTHSPIAMTSEEGVCVKTAKTIQVYRQL